MIVGPTKLPFSYPLTFTYLPSKRTLAYYAPFSIKPVTLANESFVFKGAISTFSWLGPTVNFLVFSTISGIHYCASPTKIATEIAMHL